MMRVLIVDDKEENLYLLRALLQGESWAVDEAHNGAEALTRARRTPPDLIISDLLMPVMDGYTLLRQWKADKLLQAIPFVVYTATYTEPKDERLALDLGADAFIIKPVEPDPFIARIQEVVAKKGRGELPPSGAPKGHEVGLLKEYSEVLVNKLEAKVFQLEQANRALQEEMAHRQQTEAELLQSRQDWEDIFQSIGHPTIIMDLEHGIVSANKAAIEATGKSLDELVNAKCYDLFHNSNEPPRGCPMDALLESGSSETVEMEMEALGGYYLVSCTPILDEEGNIRRVIHIATDITRRKKAEEALRQSEEGHRSLIEHLPQRIFLKDRNSVYQSCNTNYARDLGIVPEQIVGKDDFAFHPAELAQAYRADDQYCMVTGMVKDLEEPYQLAGKERWAHTIKVPYRDGQGQVIGVLGIFEDITGRKQAEQALTENRNRLRAIIETEPECVKVLDLHGRLVEMNPAGLAMLEVGSLEEAQQCPLTDYVVPEHQAAFGQLAQRVLRGETGTLEFEIRGRRSTRRWLETHATPLRDEHGRVTALLGITRDITERKRAEEEKSLYAQRLEALVKLGQMIDAPLHELAAFAMEEAVRLTRSSIGYVAFANKDESTLTMHAWSQEAMRQCGIDNKPLVYPVISTGLWGEAVRQRRPVVTNDYKLPNPWKKGTPDGHVEVLRHMNVPIFDQGRIVVVAGVGNKPADYDDNDIRQLTLLMEGMWGIVRRREAEQRLKRLGAALEQAGESILITDPSGTILYANPSFEQTTGYSLGETLGKTPALLRSGKHGESFYRDMWTTIERGEIWRGRFTNKKKDGNLYEETSTISPIKDEAGNILNFVMVGRDVTSEVLLQKQLNHAQKMEAIGTLAGGMAHDFNNLLQAVLGYADLLLMKKGPGDPDRKKLEVIQHAARDGADLVGRILTFSRKAESRVRPIDMNDEIRKAQRLLRRTIPRMIEIELVLAEDLKIIDADPAQLEQVLLNLAINAHHAMPDGGRLIIETSNVSLGDEYLRTHLGAQPGHFVLLTVSDTGVGIEPEVLERIFEPFFTTKTDGEGTGLGLSMVHGIVAQHGGYITCYSEPGRGTSFRIHFPVSAGELISDLTLPREMPAFGTETILLVDDDDRIRKMGRQMIEMGGYKVLVARSGEEALEMYAAQRDDISVVILDLIMPGMGGKRCLEELLRTDAEVRVLVASGYSPYGLSQDDKDSGARGFVSKPYDAKDILGAIRKVLDRGHL